MPAFSLLCGYSHLFSQSSSFVYVCSLTWRFSDALVEWTCYMTELVEKLQHSNVSLVLFFVDRGGCAFLFMSTLHPAMSCIRAYVGGTSSRVACDCDTRGP